MNLIVIWPYELCVTNRTSYQRIKILSENYNIYLVTRIKELIDVSLKKQLKGIVTVPVSGWLSYLFLPFAVLYLLVKLVFKREKLMFYVIYNSNILPVMFFSWITGIKVFVDFSDDPDLSTKILKIEKRKKLKYLAYYIINKIFYYFARNSVNIRGFSAIGLSRESMLPKIFIKRYSINPNKFICLPNGVDLNITNPSGKPRDENWPLRIVYVGIISPWRQTDILVEVFSKIKDYKFELILIGETIAQKDKQWLQKTREKFSWIAYKGVLPHQEVLKWIDESDVGVFMADQRVANYRYTHPIKVLEYLAMGKPVISPSFLGIKELIQEGYNGHLFDPDHPEEIIDVIRKNKENYIKRNFTKNCLASASKFDWRDINRKFIGEFKKLD